MAEREWTVPFSEISDPQTITQRNVKLFKDHDQDIHKLEVNDIIDDHERKVRVYKVRPRKFFGPWSKRG